MTVVLDRLSNMLWYLSVLVGMAVLVWRAGRSGLDQREAFLAGLFGVLGALLGGSLTVTRGLPPGISADPATWVQFVYAEKAAFGALAGGVLLAAACLFVRRQSILRFADVAAPAVALAYVIARLDCFAHGHCFGIPSDVPWAVTFDPGSQAFIAQTDTGMIVPDAAATRTVHPTQLYHATAGVLIYAVLIRWHGAWQGSRLAVALAAYGIVRFFLQFFRGDSIPVAAGLDEAQIFSILFIGAAALLWFARGRKQRAADSMSTAPASPGISVVNVQ